MKNKLILSLVVLMVAVSVLAVSAQDVSTVDSVVSESVSDDALSIDNGDDAVYQDDGTKEVWIDQTEDKSMVYIDGELEIINSSGSRLLVVPLSNSTHTSFTKVFSVAKAFENQTVNNAIDYAKEKLNIKGVKIVRGVATNTSEVYDYRKYDTRYENDGVIIGDADYLNGGYGIDPSFTITHLATGSYGRIMNLTLSYVAEAVGETENTPAVAPTQEPTQEPTENPTQEPTENPTQEPTNEPVMQDTTNSQVANNMDNTANDASAGEKNITNNAPVKAKEVVEKTGIPFAVLIVALLGIGVSVIRRK